jgi:hypothetical protein
VKRTRKNYGILGRKRTPKTTINEIPDEEESTNIFHIIKGPLTYNLGNLATGEFTEGHPTVTKRKDLWIRAKHQYLNTWRMALIILNQETQTKHYKKSSIWYNTG